MCFFLNIFKPVYKLLEHEVNALTEVILFNDDHKNVYSMAIGNILLRCTVEIEAISKELYLQLGGAPEIIDKATNKPRPPFFDSECIQLLVDTWNIDKRKIQISHSNMYFKDVIINPLCKANKRGSSGSKWKQAYQGFKHHRSEAMKQANVWNMINALGALYILNLYYADEIFWYDAPLKEKRKYATSSEIFSPFLFDAIKEKKPNKTDLEKYIFILKYTDSSYLKQQKMNYKTSIGIELQMHQTVKNNPNMASVATDNNTLFQYLLQIPSIRCDIRDVLEDIHQQEVILNKNVDVYPEFSREEFIASDEGRQLLEKFKL